MVYPRSRSPQIRLSQQQLFWTALPDAHWLYRRPADSDRALAYQEKEAL